MSRHLLRLPAATREPRFRLARARDDLRFRGASKPRGGWVQGQGDLDGEGVAAKEEESENAWPEAEEGISSARFNRLSNNVACHEEVFGKMSKAKWRVRFAPRGKPDPNAPPQRAVAPPSVHALAASSLPKEEVYRIIREAYGKTTQVRNDLGAKDPDE
eukprot:CAMPEP_0170582062 /NCGR_PEP_ID=MMETSP0224-20130122/7378_1 /TAXON_ID=285029 /ORGANISM="Togula jolla, Strain CCCM 725" /LENGTH=158 /DNA_ID=CAMNT_0010905251 /DNA_START=29 /DNA_END=505 /DNA_ORIENTATION=+